MTRLAATTCCLTLAVLALPASAQLSDIQPGRNFSNGAAAFGGNFTESVDVGDVDNDGDLDVVVANGGDAGEQPNRIFINQGGLQGGVTGSFVEETATRFAGVPNDTSRDADFADIDLDGDLDILIANRGTTTTGGQPSRFYVNQGGLQGGTLGFYVEDTDNRWGALVGVDPADEVGVADGQGPFRDYSCDCDFGDLNGDGFKDIFFSVYGPNLNGTRDSRVFLNDGAGVFNELWPWANPGADIRLHTLDVELADFDGDFDLDIFASSRESTARVYVNNCIDPVGDTPFTDITQFALLDQSAESGNGNYELEYGDLDGDGDFDVWGTNWTTDVFTFGDRVLRNDGATPGAGFRFVAESAWVKGDPLTDEFEADLLDYDGDGDLDVFAANFQGTNWIYQSGLLDGVPLADGLLHRTGTTSSGSLAAWPEMPTGSLVNRWPSRGGECADMDNDGDPDLLLANDVNQPNRYFENVLGVPDTHAPLIQAFTQQCDKPTGTATVVHAAVRDNSPFYEVDFYDCDLLYSVNTGPIVSVDMVSQGGMQFRGVIPPVTGDVIYRVECTDRSGNTGNSALAPFTQSGTTWTDVGPGLAGQGGNVPTLVGGGTWEAGSPGTLDLAAARPGATAGLFYGLASNPVPFKGGTLVPNPFFDPVVFVVPGSGAIPLPIASFPKGLPCGTQIYFQYVIQDADAVAGFALSNALRARTP